MTSSWTESTDAALAAAARTHPDAFAELYRRHVAGVYRYALARVGSTSAAEDLTAATFTEALRQIVRFRGEGSFPAWLFGIARAQTGDHYRRLYRAEEREISLENLPDDAAPDPTLTDDVVAHRLTLDSLAAALEQIPPDRAEVVRLRLIAELSTSETARLMAKSEAAVKMLLHRALADLRRSLIQSESIESES